MKTTWDKSFRTGLFFLRCILALLIRSICVDSRAEPGMSLGPAALASFPSILCFQAQRCRPCCRPVAWGFGRRDFLANRLNVSVLQDFDCLLQAQRKQVIPLIDWNQSAGTLQQVYCTVCDIVQVCVQRCQQAGRRHTRQKIASRRDIEVAS